MKKPTAKQLAARKRFAEMARSGAFKRKAAKAKTSAKRLTFTQYKAMRDDGTPVAEIRAEYGKAVVSPHETKYRNEWSKWAAKDAPKSNPSPKKRVQTPRGGCNPTFKIQAKRSGKWVTLVSESSEQRATDAAKRIHALAPTTAIRVIG